MDRETKKVFWIGVASSALAQVGIWMLYRALAGGSRIDGLTSGPTRSRPRPSSRP